jgi:RimJ/RimL family protein N-acetyltransferase
MPAELETARLLLRPCTFADLEPYVAMVSDREVTRFTSIDGKPLARFSAWQSLCSMAGHWALRGYGMFSVIERDSKQFVGRVGPWFPEGWPGLEIGWTLRREFWGRGYATEAAKACVAYAFTELDQPHVISLIAPENTRSIRVAERLGEQLETRVTLSHVPERPVLRYGLSRDAWRQTVGQQHA